MPKGYYHHPGCRGWAYRRGSTRGRFRCADCGAMLPRDEVRVIHRKPGEDGPPTMPRAGIADPADFWGPEGMNCGACIFWKDGTCNLTITTGIGDCLYMMAPWVSDAIGICGFCGDDHTPEGVCGRCADANP